MGKLSRLTEADWALFGENGNVDPDGLAAHCGVSLRTLEDFFQQVVGKPPSLWLLEHKCVTALRFIATNYKTADAAKEAGFSSASELCRVTKRLYGVTPQAFAPPLGLAIPAIPPPQSALRTPHSALHGPQPSTLNFSTLNRPKPAPNANFCA